VHVAEVSPKLYRSVNIYLEGFPNFSDILRVPRTSLKFLHPNLRLRMNRLRKTTVTLTKLCRTTQAIEPCIARLTIENMLVKIFSSQPRNAAIFIVRSLEVARRVNSSMISLASQQIASRRMADSQSSTSQAPLSIFTRPPPQSIPRAGTNEKPRIFPIRHMHIFDKLPSQRINVALGSTPYLSRAIMASALLSPLFHLRCVCSAGRGRRLSWHFECCLRGWLGETEGWREWLVCVALRNRWAGWR
jgi:hypothetical protein